MKQWLILGSTIFLFIAVWGMVLYYIVINNDQSTLAAKNTPTTSTVLYEKKIKQEKTVVTNEKKDTWTKQQTESNKLAKPSLKAGIDYGDGISIDDLLQNFGIGVNN